jgi:hypothetical protein
VGGLLLLAVSGRTPGVAGLLSGVIPGSVVS